MCSFSGLALFARQACLLPLDAPPHAAAQTVNALMEADEGGKGYEATVAPANY